MRQSPSIGVFIVRVGGAFALIIGAILIAKFFYPGMEIVASMTACAVIFIYAVLEDFKRYRKRRRKIMRKQGKLHNKKRDGR